MGPAVLLTLGLLFQLETLDRLGFSRTWPILLLVIGGVKLFRSMASTEGHLVVPPLAPPAATGSVPPVPPAPPATPSASNEVNHG
jgi:hypothetical protein